MFRNQDLPPGDHYSKGFLFNKVFRNTTKGALVMKKKKSNFELMKEIRGTWTLNPVTRVHDNNIKKNIKKERRQGKNLCKSQEDL